MTGDGTVELEFHLIMPPDRDWSIRTMAENKTSHHHTSARSPYKKIRRPANWSGGEAGGGDQR
jgi:hypothetical protein